MTIIALPQPPAEDGAPRAAVEAGASVPSRGAGSRQERAGHAPVRVACREPLPPRDEAELVRRLHAGDPDALTEIAQWLWSPLASYAWRIVQDREAAMDIAQEACMRLWERRGRDTPRSLRAYLFRITRNLAYDLLKTRRTRRRLLQRHAPARRGPPQPDEVLQRSRVTAAVQQAVQGLPERRREVFTLTYLQGLSYAEVGEVLGISPKTVQNQMSAALAHLRMLLRPLLGDGQPAGGDGADGRDGTFDRLL